MKMRLMGSNKEFILEKWVKLGYNCFVVVIGGL